MTLPINHKLTKTEINELENCKNGCELINFWNNIDKKREKGGNKMSEIHREVYNDLVKLYNKHTIERNNLSEEEFMEQLILYLVNIMENKQEYTTQYKNNPKLLLEAFYKFIELKEF